MPDVARPAEATSPPPWIRSAVRSVLEQSPNFQSLGRNERQALAQSMVKVTALAADLIHEEGQAQGEIDAGMNARTPLSRAQGQPNFAAAADRVAGTTRDVLNAVSFPRFVTDLVNGVFRAMLDSSQQQMQMYVQLLNSVSASAAGFEQSQFSLPQMRQWVADHFPEAIEYDVPETEPGEQVDPEELANIRLRLKGGAAMPNVDVIRATLGMDPTESVDASNPEQLVPLARRYIARQRQQMLATMVMLGMNRIVIDSGKINASMRFHVDTRSAANQDRGSQFSMNNRVKASGSFGVGPWGASAEVENNIGYVSTERSQTTEEMNTAVDLNSSVELNFRSDYLPLNQMAAQAQADRIRNASINPAAGPDPAAADATRTAAQLQAERERRTGVNDALATARPLSPVNTTPSVAARPPTSPATAAVASTTVSPTTAPATSPTTGTASTLHAPPNTAPGSTTAIAPRAVAPATTSPASVTH